MDRIRNAGHFTARIQRWLDALHPVGAPSIPLDGAPLRLATQPTPAPVSVPDTVPEAAPQSAPDLLPLRQLQLGLHRVEYQLLRSARRSIGFMIDDQGLRVTAPRRITQTDIEQAILAKQGWILSKLHERRERRAQQLQKPVLRWVDGAILPYIGGELTLRLHQAARQRASFNPHTLELNVWLTPLCAEMQLKERVQTWLKQDARRLFEERLNVYAGKLGVRYHSFALSSAGTRWGSCTTQAKIRLNWRLIHFSLPLIDYVVAHEVAHLREMNHSPRFWATVESIYPDCEGARIALRKRAQEMQVVF